MAHILTNYKANDVNNMRNWKFLQSMLGVFLCELHFYSLPAEKFKVKYQKIKGTMHENIELD